MVPESDGPIPKGIFPDIGPLIDTIELKITTTTSDGDGF